MNFMLAIDNLLAQELGHLDSDRGVMNLNQPRSTSKNISMPKPVVATISNWLHYDTDFTEDKVKLKLTSKLAL